MSKKWEPKLSLSEFREHLIEMRGKGKTWRKIAQELEVPRATFYSYMDRNPGLREAVDKETKTEIIENLRSTAIELALKEKNPTMIIFLCKAIAKMFDVPQADTPPEDQPEKEELHPPMTREQWKKLHDERQKKKCVS